MNNLKILKMKKILFFIFLLSFQFSYSQEEDAWIYFKDKPNAQHFLSNPLEMLSQRAIDRRNKQNISFDEKDVPLHSAYYNQIKSVDGIAVLAKSKWLNALHIKGSSNDISLLKQQFSFIEKIEFANKILNNKSVAINYAKSESKFRETLTEFNYGNAYNQINMLNGDFLHKKGFTGEGMIIALMDAGYPNVNTLPSFKRLRDNNRILGGYDFVSRDENFYKGYRHGTLVLSAIAGYKDGVFVGTAPDASFYLFITENTTNETPLEESLWVEAAEKADSLGVDVINTSLGYSKFNESKYNYTYEDMDGKTTFISRGANIGSSRGMLIVVSAGNEGLDAWKHITAPADAQGVLSVGAVNAYEVLAGFSSRGLTSDGRIKPDVMAQGEGSALLHHETDELISANGTSFSSPIMAGMVSCLWQAFPNKTAEEIKNIIREVSDRYSNPNADYGYGIPDFKKAFERLNINDFTWKSDISIYPNPASDILYFKGVDDINKTISIFDASGKKLLNFETNKNEIDISDLPKGIYFIEFNKKQYFRFLK